MYLQKSHILLLVTALLTSIAVATRPSDATLVASVDLDVEILHDDIDNSPVDEDIYNIVKRDIWADAHDLLASALLAKSKINLAERAEVLATTIKHNTKTVITDAANPTEPLDEKQADHARVKVKGNTDTQAHQGTYSAPAALRPSSLSAFQDIAKTMTPPVGKNTDSAIKSRAKSLASEPLAANIAKPSITLEIKLNSPAPNKSIPVSLAQSPSISSLPSPPTPPVISRSTQPTNPSAPSSQPTHIPISADSNANHVKRNLGTYEYIYDSTTVLVTATSLRGLTDKVPSQTRRLRFGVVSLAPVPTGKKPS